MDVVAAIADLKKELTKAMGEVHSDVKDLRAIARDCFDHLLVQEASILKLQAEHKLLEARVTLLEGQRGNPPTAA